jgi:hypothetical protein
LVRPECVLAGTDGNIWTADGRGGVMRIETDGTQQHLIPRACRWRAARPLDLVGGARIWRDRLTP